MTKEQWHDLIDKTDIETLNYKFNIYWGNYYAIESYTCEEIYKYFNIKDN